MPPPENRDRADEPVILLDAHGRPSGTAPKHLVHTTDTPLHLGFSCHLFDGAGRVLVARRAATKQTWPDVWSNACCGHPQPGETLRTAVLRRLQDELGVSADQMAVAVSDFTYRAVMPNGVVEHEVCPVVVAKYHGDPRPNPAEVGDSQWMPWDTLCERADNQPATLSPWSIDQIAQLRHLRRSPDNLVDSPDARGLDTAITCPSPHPASGNGGMADPMAPIRDDVDGVLAEFVRERTSELVELDHSLAALADEIGALIAAGGKRLRPGFVYWGYRAAGGHHHPAVARVGAAIEMLHTFALLHDDVMDRAATRRGRPAASRSFAAVHAADRLGGDERWFGTSASILAGDLAFVWADQLFDTAALDDAAAAGARRVFTKLRVEVMAGQYLDLRLDGAAMTNPEDARRVALLKSGRYTVTRPLQLGAVLAGDEDAVVAAALVTYGDAIGLAFQLRDDILGVFGDPAATGKSTTDDLSAGKRTLLVLRALRLATPTQRAVLERSLGDRHLDVDGAQRCREVLAATGALASVETLQRAQHAAAVEACAVVPEPARSALVELAALAVQRDR